MKRSVKFFNFSSPIPIVFFMVFFIAASLLPVCFPTQTSDPVWAGYRILAVDVQYADVAEQLLADASIHGVVSWKKQLYPVSTMQGQEYRHADRCSGSYYNGIRRWFFDDVNGLCFFYMPFPESVSAQKQYYETISQALLPVVGGYTLERPAAAGSMIYGVFFIIAAVAVCFFLRRFSVLIFLVPFCVPLLAIRSYIFLLSALFDFSAVLLFFCLFQNDGFASFDHKSYRRALCSPFVILPVAAGLIISWFSGWQSGLSSFLSVTACVCGVIMLHGFRQFLDLRRLHPRLSLVKLFPATDYVLPFGTFASVGVFFLAVTLSGLIFCMSGSGESGDTQSVPDSVPVAVYQKSAATAFSADNFTESLQPQAVDRGVRVPALAEYLSQQWFERMRLYMPAATVVGVERGEIQPLPQMLSVRHFALSDGKIVQSEEVFMPDVVLSDCLQDLPPLEQMMMACGRFVPVWCIENGSDAYTVSNSNVFSVPKVLPAIFLPLAVFGLCFLKLYRSGRRQNHFFQVLLNVRSSEQ